MAQPNLKADWTVQASPPTDTRTPQQVLAGYESFRERLPRVDFSGVQTRAVDGLLTLAEDFDVFVFDAFGVLNVGTEAVPGAAACLQQLMARDKQVFLLSNGASLTRARWHGRMQQLGFLLQPEQLINSRDAMLAGSADLAGFESIGAILPSDAEIHDLPATVRRPEDADFWQADLFLFMSADGWTAAQQAELIHQLRARPRLLVLANPDLAAPRAGGLGPQPGFYALETWPDDLQELVVPFGKPFPDIFSLLLQQLPPAMRRRPERILMVGDTLHTDILGGRAAGFHTALVTGQGVLTGLDIDACIRQTGIVPHYRLETI